MQKFKSYVSCALCYAVNEVFKCIKKFVDSFLLLQKNHLTVATVIEIKKIYRLIFSLLFSFFFCIYTALFKG